MVGYKTVSVSPTFDLNFKLMKIRALKKLINTKFSPISYEVFRKKKDHLFVVSDNFANIGEFLHLTLSPEQLKHIHLTNQKVYPRLLSLYVWY